MNKTKSSRTKLSKTMSKAALNKFRNSGSSVKNKENNKDDKDKDKEKGTADKDVDQT